MTPPNALWTSSAFSKQASKQTKRQRCHVKRLKVESQYQIFLSLTYILVTKKIPSNVSVSGNAKTDSSQTRANDLANTLTTGKKRASKRVSTPTQDAEQTPLPPKKKMKASVEPSQPSATTTAMERNHGAPSKSKRTDNSAKKRPAGDESNDASISAHLAHPTKKNKVDKQEALPIRRSGKTILNF